MSERAARAVLVVVSGGLLALACGARIPQFWADGATYHAMAWSLAEDGDLRYEARDIFRVRRELPSGPQGIFLKRASGGLIGDRAAGLPWLRRVGTNEPRIYFAKAFLYPLAAAPFVKLFGTRGLLITNALCLSLAIVLAYSELRRHASTGRALAAALLLFLGTVAPLYLFWPQPELFNLALVTAALVAWRRERPLLAAVLIGLAAYSKPYNVLLALPLGVEPLLRGRFPSVAKGLAASALRAAVVAATVLALFGANKAVTGEMNYQGGERKTFYGTFPFETQAVTFGNSGIWATTNELGPAVEESGAQATAARPARGAAPPRSGAEMRASFFRNLGYFWVGRYAGVLPYFFPAFVALVFFLVRGPRTTAGWLAVAALALSYLFYVWAIPDNWYGGGGTIGNRYFLNLLPLAIFFIPRGAEWVVAASGLLCALWLSPVFAAPVAHSLRPGDHAMRQPFRSLPAELTMLNDLSVFTDPWRKKRPVGDTEGDARRSQPADPRAYYLYFPDDGTFGREEREGVPGFWLRGGARAEVILRALEPVWRMKVTVVGGPAGDEVAVSAGGRTQTLSVGAGESATAELATGPGFAWYDTFVHVLHFRSTRSAPLPGADRSVGAFVHVDLDVDRRVH
ncbi:MAG TPA: glycosyltransferase family 87 protein [Vicinamibacteria bacterium]